MGKVNKAGPKKRLLPLRHSGHHNVASSSSSSAAQSVPLTQQSKAFEIPVYGHPMEVRDNGTVTGMVSLPNIPPYSTELGGTASPPFQQPFGTGQTSEPTRPRRLSQHECTDESIFSSMSELTKGSLFPSSLGESHLSRDIGHTPMIGQGGTFHQNSTPLKLGSTANETLPATQQLPQHLQLLQHIKYNNVPSSSPLQPGMAIFPTDADKKNTIQIKFADPLDTSASRKNVIGESLPEKFRPLPLMEDSTDGGMTIRPRSHVGPFSQGSDPASCITSSKLPTLISRTCSDQNISVDEDATGEPPHHASLAPSESSKFFNPLSLQKFPQSNLESITLNTTVQYQCVMETDMEPKLTDSEDCKLQVSESTVPLPEAEIQTPTHITVSSQLIAYPLSATLSHVASLTQIEDSRCNDPPIQRQFIPETLQSSLTELGLDLPSTLLTEPNFQRESHPQVAGIADIASTPSVKSQPDRMKCVESRLLLPSKPPTSIKSSPEKSESSQERTTMSLPTPKRCALSAFALDSPPNFASVNSRVNRKRLMATVTDHSRCVKGAGLFPLVSAKPDRCASRTSFRRFKMDAVEPTTTHVDRWSSAQKEDVPPPPPSEPVSEAIQREEELLVQKRQLEMLLVSMEQRRESEKKNQAKEYKLSTKVIIYDEPNVGTEKLELMDADLSSHSSYHGSIDDDESISFSHVTTVSAKKKMNQSIKVDVIFTPEEKNYIQSIPLLGQPIEQSVIYSPESHLTRSGRCLHESCRGEQISYCGQSLCTGSISEPSIIFDNGVGRATSVVSHRIKEIIDDKVECKSSGKNSPFKSNTRMIDGRLHISQPKREVAAPPGKRGRSEKIFLHLEERDSERSQLYESTNPTEEPCRRTQPGSIPQSNESFNFDGDSIDSLNVNKHVKRVNSPSLKRCQSNSSRKRLLEDKINHIRKMHSWTTTSSDQSVLMSNIAFERECKKKSVDPVNLSEVGIFTGDVNGDDISVHDGTNVGTQVNDVMPYQLPTAIRNFPAEIMLNTLQSRSQNVEDLSKFLVESPKEFGKFELSQNASADSSKKSFTESVPQTKDNSDGNSFPSFSVKSLSNRDANSFPFHGSLSHNHFEVLPPGSGDDLNLSHLMKSIDPLVSVSAQFDSCHIKLPQGLSTKFKSGVNMACDTTGDILSATIMADDDGGTIVSALSEATGFSQYISCKLLADEGMKSVLLDLNCDDLIGLSHHKDPRVNMTGRYEGMGRIHDQLEPYQKMKPSNEDANVKKGVDMPLQSLTRICDNRDTENGTKVMNEGHGETPYIETSNQFPTKESSIQVESLNIHGSYDGLLDNNTLLVTQHSAILKNQTKSLISDPLRHYTHSKNPLTDDSFIERGSNLLCPDQPALAASCHSYVGEHNLQVLGSCHAQFDDNTCVHLTSPKTDLSRDDSYNDTNNSPQGVQDSNKHPNVVNLFASTSPKFDFSNLSSYRCFDRVRFGGEVSQHDTTNPEKIYICSDVELSEDTTEEMTSSKSASFISPGAPILKEQACPAIGVSENPTMTLVPLQGNTDEGLQISGFLSTLSSSLPDNMPHVILKGYSAHNIHRHSMQDTPAMPLGPQPQNAACCNAEMTNTSMNDYERYNQHEFISYYPTKQQQKGYQHQQNQFSQQYHESLSLHQAQPPVHRTSHATEMQDALREIMTRQAENMEKTSASIEPVKNSNLTTLIDFIPFNEMEYADMSQSRAHQSRTDISNGKMSVKGESNPSDGSFELTNRSQRILSHSPELATWDDSRMESALETEQRNVFSFQSFFGHVAEQVAEHVTEMIRMKERHTGIYDPTSGQSQHLSVVSVPNERKSATFVSYEEARARFHQDDPEGVTNMVETSTNHKKARLQRVNRWTEQKRSTPKSLQSRFGRRRSSGVDYLSLHPSSTFNDAHIVMHKESSNYLKEYMHESGRLGKIESEYSKPHDVVNTFSSQTSTPTKTCQNNKDASHSSVDFPALWEQNYYKNPKRDYICIAPSLNNAAGTLGFWYLPTDSPVSESVHDVEQVSTNDHTSSVDIYEVDAAMASRYDNSLSILGPKFKKSLAKIRDTALISVECTEESKSDNKTIVAKSESEVKALSNFGPRLKGKVTNMRVKASLADDSEEDEFPTFEIPPEDHISSRPNLDREDIKSLESESSLFTTSSDERRRTALTNTPSKVRSTSESSSTFSKSDWDSVSNSYSDSDSNRSGSSNWTGYSGSYSNDDVEDDRNDDNNILIHLKNQGCDAKRSRQEHSDEDNHYQVDIVSRESVLSKVQYQNQIGIKGNRLQEGDVVLLHHDRKPETEVTQEVQVLQRQESESLFVRMQQTGFAGMANLLWEVKDAVRPEFHNNDDFEHWDIDADSNEYDLAEFALDSEEFDVRRRPSENEGRFALSTGDGKRTRRVRRKKSRGVESEGCAQKWSHAPRIYIVSLFGFIIMLTIIFSTSLSGLENDKSDPRLSTIPTTLPSGSPTSIVFGNKSWSQVGETLQGFDRDDQNGFSISISDDGTRVAVGARRASTDGITRRGNVRVYHIVDSSGKPTWAEEASFDGENAGDQFGFSVKLSADGLRLAAGSIGSDTVGSNSGLVRMFGLNANIWKPIGEFGGEDAGDLFGLSIDLSANGRLLCVGAPYHSGNDQMQSGKVYFYEDLGDDGNPLWEESRAQLFGTSVGDSFGWSVTLNADASRVAIGAPLIEGSVFAGYVRIYEIASPGTVWTLLGQDVSINNMGDRFGFSLSMDGIGERVAVGAYRSLDTGQVNVFKLANNTWLPLGETLVGDFPDEEFGFSVSLSPDGNYVAVGAPSQNNAYGGMGAARVFEYQPKGLWIPSFDIMGEGKAQLGGSVSLTSYATNVAIGLPAANEARVYA